MLPEIKTKRPNVEALGRFQQHHPAPDPWPGAGVHQARLVNTLSILSPYGPEEKQALLEAPDLRSRAQALVALAEMELAARDDGSGTSLQ